jgi:hypothetical protein
MQQGVYVATPTGISASKAVELGAVSFKSDFKLSELIKVRTITEKRGISINPIPEVTCYNVDEELADKPDISPIPVPQCTTIVNSCALLYCNVSYFSNAVKDYFASLPKEVKAVLGCELHQPVESVDSWCNSNSFSASYTPPEDTIKGNHGGELVAIRSKFHSRPVNQEILDQISGHYGTLRFAAMILTLKGVEFLIVTLYLWHTEGFTDRNIKIL